MLRKSLSPLPLAAASLALALCAVPAQADGTKAGVLNCRVSGGVGFIITSSKALNCVFESTGGKKERYIGTISRFGLDIGITGPGEMNWVVLAPTSGAPAGALAGEYVGATASISAGAGVGANALVGGFGRSLTLQPVSLQVQTGGDLAAGVASMTLEAVR